MKFDLECEREDDGRWLAEVSQLPGVLAYGASANEAMTKAEVLALRVLAEQLASGRGSGLAFCVPPQDYSVMSRPHFASRSPMRLPSHPASRLA